MNEFDYTFESKSWNNNKRPQKVEEMKAEITNQKTIKQQQEAMNTGF